MVDSRLAFDIVAKGGNSAAAEFEKVARGADNAGSAMKKNSKISEEAAKASANLTKAHDNESTALDRVHLAEEKLSEVRNNSKAKTSQVVAAENALSKARRDAAAAGNTAQKAAKDLTKVLDDEGKKAGPGLGKSVLHWFTGAGKDFEKAGKQAGDGVSSGMMGVLKTPILGPALVAGAVAVAATVAPAAGAIVAGGIVTGFGAGLAGLGLVFAAKSEAVQQQWKRTLDSMGSQMRTLSKPFENTLIAMSLVAKRTFASFAPILGDAFKRMAPVLTTFGDQFGRALERLKPALLPLTDAFNAVLTSLGPAVQDMIGKVSDGLIKLSASVQRSPGAVADLVRGLGDLVKTSLDLIAALNDMNAKFKDLTGISAVTAVMDGLNGVLKGSELALKSVTAPIGLLDAGLQKIGLKGKAASDNQATFSSNLFATAAAINKLIPPTETLAQKFARQAAATQQSNDALARQANLLLALSGSQIAYQQALDDATASVKANGKTLDLNTQKGRDNRTALNNVASAAIAQVAAMRNAGDGNVKAARFAEQARVSFVKQAVQMGMSKRAAQDMAVSLIKIPNVTRTAKLLANKADLDAKLAKAKAQLADPKLTATKRAKLEATIAQLQAQVRAAQAAINGVHGKTVPITITYTSGGIPRTFLPGSSTPGRASGGPVTKGHPYIVGEHRPELFVPKQDGTIIPRVPGRAQGTAFSGGGTTINVYVTGALDSRDAADKIVNSLRKFVRVSAGGDVQAALGR